MSEQKWVIPKVITQQSKDWTEKSGFQLIGAVCKEDGGKEFLVVVCPNCNCPRFVDVQCDTCERRRMEEVYKKFNKKIAELRSFFKTI